MAEKTSSNSNEAFSEAEKNELQVETKRAQYYVSVLEQEIHMLQQEMSEISRESEEGNIQYKEISSTIINKRIQQREIREILVHINQGAQIDTDNFFLNKLKELNNQAEQNGNLEIKYLVDMKDNVRVTSSQLRFELESELEYNSASENLKSVLEGRMTLAIEEGLNDPKELGRLVIDSLIEIKGLEWANSQAEQGGLDIPKSDFYRILAKAFIRMEKSEVKKFRDSIIYITLQGTPEIFRGDDEEISKILDIIIGAEKEEPTHEQESVIDRPANNSSQKTGLVKPMSLEIPQRKERISESSDIPTKNQVLELIENSRHIRTVIEILIREELTGRTIHRKESDGGNILFSKEFINNNLDTLIDNILNLSVIFGEIESNLNPQGRNGYNREGINTLKTSQRRSSAKGMWQYLTENGKIKTAYEYEFRIKGEESVWRYLAAGEKPTSGQRKRQKEYWATSSHGTAHNHVYDLSARVENSELKNVLLKIAPDRIDARRKGLDARKLSVEEQAIMFLVDLFKNPRAVKNANGQRVKVEDYLGLAAMGNNWSQDMIYAIFHHTSPDDAGVRSNMKRGRDVVNGLTG